MAEPANLPSTGTPMDTSFYRPANQIMATPSDPVPEPASNEVEIQDIGNLAEPVKIVSSEDQKTLLAVLQFLRKNNLSGTVDALQKETEKAGGRYTGTVRYCAQFSHCATSK